MQFGSDNHAGVSARIMESIGAANAGHAHGYGDDPWTKRATAALRDIFQCELEAFFVSTGTAANSLALSCLVQSWESVLCHNHSHILNDELTAPEFFTGGARLVGISQGAGKLTAQHLDDYFAIAGQDATHNPRAAALSITQATENGLVYTPAEINQLTAAAHARQLKVHMDGARFANAVASLQCAPADISSNAGVDVLCLGATKNGALAAEVVIFFDRSAAKQFEYRRKRAGHLLSKSRFVGAQFVAWLANDHWLELATHANLQCALLAKGLASIPAIRIVWPTDANEIFAVLPKLLAEQLRTAGAEFYDWPAAALPAHAQIEHDQTFVRLVTSFATQDSDIASFLSIARKAAHEHRAAG